VEFPDSAARAALYPVDEIRDWLADPVAYESRRPPNDNRG
jgi:hypothetical protein